jgi:hypothetical protein
MAGLDRYRRKLTSVERRVDALHSADGHRVRLMTGHDLRLPDTIRPCLNE